MGKGEFGSKLSVLILKTLTVGLAVHVIAVCTPAVIIIIIIIVVVVAVVTLHFVHPQDRPHGVANRKTAIDVYGGESVTTRMESFHKFKV
jgi:hypothetical protein